MVRYVSESNHPSWGGIRVTARENVTIRNCTITGFFDNGVIFTDGAGYPSSFPTNAAFCVGNKFHDNILTNCATFYDGNYGTGGMQWGGQQDMLVYNNLFQQNERALGDNGWPIKYYANGALRNMKFYNNVVRKIPLVGGYMGQGGWTFAWEGYQQYGIEVYNCQFFGGSIDWNETRSGLNPTGGRNYAGAQPYGAWIHDNTFDLGTPNSGHWTPAIQLEFYSEDIIIERNVITDYSIGILHSGRTGDPFKNNIIRNNLISNIGWQEGNGGAIMIQNDANNGLFDNNKIYNNTLTGNPSYKPLRLIEFDGSTSGGTGANNEIINNILVGASAEAISIWGVNRFTNLKIQNNNYYQNGNNGVLFQQGLTPGSGYVNSGNTTVVPGFVGGTNYTLAAGSAMIDAGINVGLPYNGAAPDKGYAESAGSGGNVAPTANAGADQTITLPTSSVSLTGSGTDPDGTIASYAWTKVSGPAGGAIATPNAASTNITGLTTAGTYVYRLTVTDNLGLTGTNDVQIIVNNAPNAAPTANAGPDQTITLPTSSVTLNGSGTDPDGTIASYSWAKVSGPAVGTIASPATASTAINGLTSAGTYVYRLTVTDNGGATATNDVQIIVNSAPPANVAPTANAGANQTITLPTSSVTLTGSGTDTDGSIASYAWTKVSGPAGGAIGSPATASTGITGMTTAGTYVFRLTVTDNSGATGTDDVSIIVNSAPPANVAPTANAGANQTITLPTSSVTLTGSGTDTDGSIASYAWTKVSGPAGGAIGSPATASTGITGMTTAGTYVFRLTVTDNAGATGTDDVSIIVNSAPPANVAPTANAGANQTITLPTSSVTLTGSGTDTDGSIASYAWTKVSGPAGGAIGSPATASTGITGMTTAGTYVFRLTVTDNCRRNRN